MSNGFWAMQLFCFVITYLCSTSLVASTGNQNRGIVKDLGLALLMTIAIMGFANFFLYMALGGTEHWHD